MRTLILLLCFACTACGNTEAPAVAQQPQLFETSVTIVVRDKADKGIPGFPISFDKTIVGKTDRNGIFKATFKDAPKTPFEVEVLELDGYEFESEVLKFEERVELRPDKDGNPVGVPVTHKVTVRSLRVENMFWVKADCDKTLECADLNVYADDEVVATTNEFGYAQFIVERIPESKINIKIETPDDTETEAFAPAMPTFQVTTALDSKIFRLEQKFADVGTKPKRRGPVRSISRNKRPKRKGASKKSSKKKKKKKKKTTTKKKKNKKDGVIDLF